MKILGFASGRKVKECNEPLERILQKKLIQKRHMVKSHFAVKKTVVLLFCISFLKITRMGKSSKSEAKETTEEQEIPVVLAPIAKPLAGRKLSKKLLKLTKKGKLSQLQ
jgi:hypothetical protein